MTWNSCAETVAMIGDEGRLTVLLRMRSPLFAPIKSGLAPQVNEVVLQKTTHGSRSLGLVLCLFVIPMPEVVIGSCLLSLVILLHDGAEMVVGPGRTLVKNLFERVLPGGDKFVCSHLVDLLMYGTVGISEGIVGDVEVANRLEMVEMLSCGFHGMKSTVKKVLSTRASARYELTRYVQRVNPVQLYHNGSRMRETQERIRRANQMAPNTSTRATHSDFLLVDWLNSKVEYLSEHIFCITKSARRP
jgi:hypothetical protein